MDTERESDFPKNARLTANPARTSTQDQLHNLWAQCKMKMRGLLCRHRQQNIYQSRGPSEHRLHETAQPLPPMKPALSLDAQLQDRRQAAPLRWSEAQVL